MKKAILFQKLDLKKEFQVYIQKYKDLVKCENELIDCVGWDSELQDIVMDSINSNWNYLKFVNVCNKYYKKSGKKTRLV